MVAGNKHVQKNSRCTRCTMHDTKPLPLAAMTIDYTLDICYLERREVSCRSTPSYLEKTIQRESVESNWCLGYEPHSDDKNILGLVVLQAHELANKTSKHQCLQQEVGALFPLVSYPKWLPITTDRR